VVHQLDAEIQEEKVTALIGANGSGKGSIEGVCIIDFLYF
jgi:ABC-type cobalamin/Fe3+-siderophores transport system ATPase subunit